MLTVTTAPVLRRTGSCMRAGYALDGDGSCVSDTRRHTAAFLDKARAEHDLTAPERVRDLTTLVVSELAPTPASTLPAPC
ncbi:hypothetical protein [Streptomyces sp. NPDC058861]|uniref:hypothetical protein n=1 Tax=Streptomyces sp. NPDC058861 TaxID=3346653 RepID=UPI00368E5ECD